MHVIRIFHSPEEAWTALSLLQAHKVDAQILDSQTLSVLPLDSVALGGYRLAVPEHQAELSLSLLDDDQHQPISPENRQYFGDEYDGVQLRSAGHSDSGRSGRTRLIALGSVALFLLIAFGSKYIWPIGNMDWLF